MRLFCSPAIVSRISFASFSRPWNRSIGRGPCGSALRGSTKYGFVDRPKRIHRFSASEEPVDEALTLLTMNGSFGCPSGGAISTWRRFLIYIHIFDIYGLEH